MKKLVCAVILLIGAISLSGCKKQALLKKEDILGNWVLEKTGYENPLGSGEVLTASPPDTYYIMFEVTGKLTSNYPGPWTGTWEYKNGNFYVKQDGLDEFNKYGILYLDDQKMIHYFDIGIGNNEFKRYTQYFIK